MRTATFVVNSKWNNYNRIKCRLLFDNPSQRTHISKKLVDTIKVDIIRTEYLVVGTFGALTTECSPRDVIRITVLDRADQEKIKRENMQPYTVPKIRYSCEYEHEIK